VLAHVDQHGHPGLFAKLKQISVGDVVEIDRSDGQTAVFRVNDATTYPKAEADQESQAIYGNTPDPQLRLITCTGTVDPKAHSYLSQEVVFASLIALHPTIR
jgi:sortase (surface protein transpeptidase)